MRPMASLLGVTTGPKEEDFDLDTLLEPVRAPSSSALQIPTPVAALPAAVFMAPPSSPYPSNSTSSWLPEGWMGIDSDAHKVKRQVFQRYNGDDRGFLYAGMT